VVTPLKLYTRFGHSLYEKMRKKLFFGEILVLLIEGYLDFAISFFIYNIYDPKQNESILERSGFSEFVKFSVMILIFVVIPAAIIHVVI
jgi:hypothetical protein